MPPMRVRVTDPAAAADLSEFLRARVGAVVEQTSPRRPDAETELEVSLLGSYGEDALRSELEAALRRWAIARRRPTPELET